MCLMNIEIQLNRIRRRPFSYLQRTLNNMTDIFLDELENNPVFSRCFKYEFTQLRF